MLTSQKCSPLDKVLTRKCSPPKKCSPQTAHLSRKCSPLLNLKGPPRKVVTLKCSAHKSAHLKVFTHQKVLISKCSPFRIVLTLQKVLTSKCSSFRKVLARMCSPHASQEVNTRHHCGRGIEGGAWDPGLIIPSPFFFSGTDLGLTSRGLLSRWGHPRVAWDPGDQPRLSSFLRLGCVGSSLAKVHQLFFPLY